MELQYCVGVQSSSTVWTGSRGPRRPPVRKKRVRGRAATLLRRDPNQPPQSAKEAALSLPSGAWRTVSWREGTNHTLRSRFAALRVRVAHRDYNRTREREEEWLLIEWPHNEAEPAKILAQQPACDDKFEDSGAHGQGALAHRAGLSGAQTGVRSGALRGARLVRLSSPREPVYCRLRLFVRPTPERRWQ